MSYCDGCRYLHPALFIKCSNPKVITSGVPEQAPLEDTKPSWCPGHEGDRTTSLTPSPEDRIKALEALVERLVTRIDAMAGALHETRVNHNNMAIRLAKILGENP